ncbi:MAG TPA: hypothetical protein VHP11_09810, partial [Tepidisphaeraceae bacterium]|nr:hypothetical protein [Tepidisphaeraceae bacterium]
RASANLLIELEEGIRIYGKLIDAKTDQPLSGTVVATLANTEDPSPTYGGVNQDGSWDLYLPRDAEYLIRFLPTGNSEYQDFKTISVKRAQPPQELIIRAQRSQ